MRKYKLTDTVKLYHLSFDRLGDEVFYPRVPNERAQFEDGTIPRICVSTSIRGCLKGLGIDGTHHHVFLYTPVEYKGKKIKDHIFKPTVDEVPDVVETREKWITCPVKMKYLGIVDVIPHRSCWGRDRDKVIIYWEK